MAYNYFCKNSLNNPNCGLCHKGDNIVLEKEDYPYKCESNGKTTLKCIGQTTNLGIGKMTVQQIQADRKARSRQHFQNEIMPNIPKSTAEGKYFRKKYSKKGN